MLLKSYLRAGNCSYISPIYFLIFKEDVEQYAANEFCKLNVQANVLRVKYVVKYDVHDDGAMVDSADLNDEPNADTNDMPAYHSRPILRKLCHNLVMYFLEHAICMMAKDMQTNQLNTSSDAAKPIRRTLD